MKTVFMVGYRAPQSDVIEMWTLYRKAGKLYRYEWTVSTPKEAA
jgi:hypothetical protein